MPTAPTRARARFFSLRPLVARIRTIKPEFWTDEILGSMSDRARLLYVSTWNHADDAGSFQANPALLRAQAWAYRPDVAVADVEAALGELQSAGRINLYLVEGQQYGSVKHWNHQRIERPSPARFPLPQRPTGGGDDGDSPRPHRTLTEPSPNPHRGSSSTYQEKEKEKETAVLLGGGGFENPKPTPTPQATEHAQGVGKNGKGDPKKAGAEASPDTPWPAELQDVLGVIRSLRAPSEFYNAGYWARIDEWLGAKDSGVAYLDELRKFLAWHEALPKTQRKRNLLRAFRNWLAKAQNWSENRAQRQAIQRTR